MEAAAEDPVGGGEEGDQEVEGPVEGTGPSGRRDVQPGGADFLSSTDVGRWVPGEEDDAVSAVSELEVQEWMEVQRAGGEERDGEEPPLFLPTPDFMASAGEG